MTPLFLVFAGLVLLVLVLLLSPLLRRSSLMQPRLDFDLAVYRDQLAEIDRDRERGVLDAAQAESVRTEIHRRLLVAEDAEKRSTVAAEEALLPVKSWTRLAVACVIAIAIPTATLGIYNYLGAPNLPGQPIASRQSSPDFKMTAMAERLKARLVSNPNIDGFTLLGRTYRNLGRYDEAIAAFQQAINMGGASAEVYSAMGEALTMVEDGGIGPEARAAFLQAYKLDPSDFAARFYLGLSQAQISRFKEAIAIWRDLEKDAPPDAGWRPMVDAQIAQAAKDGNLDPASVPPQPPVAGGAPPVNLAAIDQKVAALDKSSPEIPATAESKDQMIRAMVARLAARLQEAPDDLDGWLRLAKSYKVLGDLPKAREAASRAAKLSPQSPDVKNMLADLGGVPPQGLAAVDQKVAAMDPSSPEIPATAEGKDQMIHAMVARLAARMEQTPDDLEGWLRLAKSYQVLGDLPKAHEAAARAAKLSPESADVKNMLKDLQ